MRLPPGHLVAPCPRLAAVGRRPTAGKHRQRPPHARPGRRARAGLGARLRLRAGLRTGLGARAAAAGWGWGRGAGPGGDGPPPPLPDTRTCTEHVAADPPDPVKVALSVKVCPAIACVGVNCISASPVSRMVVPSRVTYRTPDVAVVPPYDTRIDCDGVVHRVEVDREGARRLHRVRLRPHRCQAPPGARRSESTRCT